MFLMHLDAARTDTSRLMAAVRSGEIPHSTDSRSVLRDPSAQRAHLQDGGLPDGLRADHRDGREVQVNLYQRGMRKKERRQRDAASVLLLIYVKKTEGRRPRQS